MEKAPVGAFSYVNRFVPVWLAKQVDYLRGRRPLLLPNPPPNIIQANSIKTMILPISPPMIPRDTDTDTAVTAPKYDMLFFRSI